MYKISQYLSVPSVIELFTEKEVIWNTRSNVKMIMIKHIARKNWISKFPKSNTTQFDLETIKKMSPIIWSSVPEDTKTLNHSIYFENKLNASLLIIVPVTFAKILCKAQDTQIKTLALGTIYFEQDLFSWRFSNNM